MANNSLTTANGSIVYIDGNNQYMFDLKNRIRFIDASEYHIDGPKMFFGFLSGIAAQDFDLEYIFIDGFLKIVRHELDTLEGLFLDLEQFTEKRDIKIIISISGKSDQVPEFMHKYIVKQNVVEY